MFNNNNNNNSVMLVAKNRISPYTTKTNNTMVRILLSEVFSDEFWEYMYELGV